MASKSLWLLLKKNLLVERKSYVQTSLEIALILIIFYLLLQIESHETVEKVPIHSDFKLNDLLYFKKLMLINESTIPYKLYFSPNDSYTQKIFEITAKKLSLIDAVGFDSEEDMVEHFDSSTVLAGAILQGHDVTLRFPNYFRTRPNKNLFTLTDFWLTRCSGVLADEENNSDFYIREGFLQLLYTIVRTQFEEENTQWQEFPTSISSLFLGMGQNVGCANDLSTQAITRDRLLKWSLYYFIYFLPFLNLIWKISREHEENIFAHHWIYGFSYNTQTLAHIIVALFHLILLDTVVFIILTYFWPAMPAWKSILLFAFLSVHNALLILYALMISLFLKNAKTAVLCGSTLWIISYAVFLETLNAMNFNILKPERLFISVVFFNNLLPNGLLDYFEGAESKSLQEIISFLGVQLLMLAFYGCLFKCIEWKWPGRYIKRFPSTKNKEKCKKCIDFKANLYEKNIEYGPLSGEVLQLKNVYSSCDHLKKRTRLQNISMRFCKNEISVILGPHNSGKTMFISTLAGWQAYKGRIAYHGHEICEDWKYYRQHVDVSMPNNALFDRLTIRETLNYFILLKQTDNTDLELEQKKWLNIIKPVADWQEQVKALSFGEKRLVALCCAMVCNTSVVLLDEPTLHMEAEHQNRYWNILIAEKKERVIIVTTFNVDEANEIGDRIGILRDGCLTAWGSSYFLRNQIGGQFYLVCFLQPMTPIEPITQLLEKYVANLKMHNHSIDRVIYIIPADKKSTFQRFLLELEKDASALGITNIYIVGSSLNEVYMALTMKQDIRIHLPDTTKILKLVVARKSELKNNLFQAILYKRLLRQSKNLLPICIIFTAFCLILAMGHMPPAHLNVDSITISGQALLQDGGPLIEVLNVDHIENGIFYYNNVKYDNYAYQNTLRKDYNSFAALEVNKPAALEVYNPAATISIWFNERIFHSAPLALNLAFNYLTNSSASTYINKPIILQGNYDVHIILGTIMPLAMSMVFVNLQEDRSSSMLTLQKMARLNEGIQWSATFLWDFCISLLIAVLYLIILTACVMNKSSWPIAIAAFTLFFLCSMASLLFMYLMSYKIVEDNMIRAFIKIFLLQFSLGLLPYVLYTNILYSNFEHLFYVFMLSPGFSVLHATTKIFDNREVINISSYLQWHSPGILDSVFFISLMSILYLMMFVAVNVHRRAVSKSTPKKVKEFASICYPYDEERVVKEKVRIANMNIESCRAQAVLVDQLESKLPMKENRINTISFALNKYSCLGIYGSNHSGKSHLLKQLVGEKDYWFGRVYIAGFNTKKEMAKALEQVGYCPQNKGFNMLLTPTELFRFFLMLYNVNKSKHLDHIHELCVALQLRNYMNSRMEDLPENIKRRINLGVALIACEKILILDEPTSGLPAYDRLLIWNIIKFYRSRGNTIIFTTSESLELKELADTVLAVNNGEMLSYKNPHQMECQYNSGFHLEIKLYADGLTLEEVEENLNADIDNLNRFIIYFHEDSELLYRYNNVIKYYIPIENVIYSYIFGSIEKNRNRLNIADYTLTPFSLNKALKYMQKSRKEKIHYERSRAKLLRNPKILPRKY